MKSNQRMRILLIKPSSMGDVIHALPVVSAIHRHHPDAEIRWLLQPAWRMLLGGNPAISETVLFPRDKFRGLYGWLGALAWLRILGDWKPDMAIDLQGLLRSALIARISGAPKVIGLSDAREGAALLHGESVKVNRHDHAVRRYLALLGHLEIPQPVAPEFVLPEGHLPAVFNATSPYVVLHPYARGEGKSLDEGMIHAFLRGVTAHPGYRVIIVGRGKPIDDLPKNVEDWSNRTDLLELIGILRASSFSVSSDSGPMHLAVALNPSKTLAIHLWSDPLKVGPFFASSFVWKNGKTSTVSGLDESWRGIGRPPTQLEMEALGHFAVAESIS